ncbi:MAG: TIGR03560 family F420-dependent LLM class oxidoreductase [Anaerolineales bacterium]|nr:TIGR03560 family F420-dependent LLM class oxidoreductase [Anaerolineales bacterium]MCB8953154.1 TIGR03560 family F420-dependent LLM class oxidoreductase [Ardenticatenales bacterium]
MSQIEVAIMIEGQNGLTWPRWQRIAHAVESLGYVGLYRSDHFTNANPPDKDSLELWVSLTWLASHTQRLEFGPLVSPVSFRHPTFTARMAAAVDDLSGGRLTLGMGAGWQVREHTHFGWDLLEMAPRFARFIEGLEVVTRLLHSDDPVDYAGTYYHLQEAILLPRPLRPGGPPILIGGNGPKRTLPLVAQYATEWNAVFTTPAVIRQRNQALDALLQERGRAPADVRRSLMTGCWFGKDDAAVNARLQEQGRSFAQMREIGIIVGTGNQIVDQLGELAEVGVQRVMLQWLDLDDVDGLEAMAHAVLPQVGGR